MLLYFPHLYFPLFPLSVASNGWEQGHFFWLAGPRGCAEVHCCAVAGEESTMAPKGRKRKAKEPEAKAVNSEDVKTNGGANTLPKRLRGEGSQGPGPRVVIEHCKS
ncbi:unnamed protein product [Natator depressus]